MEVSEPQLLDNLPKDRSLVLYRAPGRPSMITKELTDKICDLTAAGVPLHEICAPDDMPSQKQVYYWLWRYQQFGKDFQRARAAMAHVWADHLIDIVDDGRNDYMEKFDNRGNFLGYFVNGEAVQRSRLRFEARKWLMGKFNSAYADKTGSDGLNAKQVNATTQDDDIGLLFANLSGKTAGLPCTHIKTQQPTN